MQPKKKIIGKNQKCPQIFSRGTKNALTIDSVSRAKESFKSEEKKYFGKMPINDKTKYGISNLRALWLTYVKKGFRSACLVYAKRKPLHHTNNGMWKV